MDWQEHIIFCYASNKQWGVGVAKNNHATITLPLTQANVIAGSLQHFGYSAQYYGIINNKPITVTSSLNEDDSFSYVFICK